MLSFLFSCKPHGETSLWREPRAGLNPITLDENPSIHSAPRVSLDRGGARGGEQDKVRSEGFGED